MGSRNVAHDKWKKMFLHGIFKILDIFPIFFFFLSDLAWKYHIFACKQQPQMS